MALVAKRNLDAVMHEAFLVKPRRNAGLLQQANHALLDHARADSAEHIVRAPVLQNDRVDALLVQKLAEQEPGRPGADDRDLCAHWIVISKGGSGRTL
jgi:hypothetical protein